jgi:hypothetical protein
MRLTPLTEESLCSRQKTEASWAQRWGDDLGGRSFTGERSERFRSRRIIRTYGGLEVCFIGGYFTGAVRNENTNWKGVGPFRGRVCCVVFPERDLLRDLVRFLMAHLLNLPFLRL